MTVNEIILALECCVQPYSICEGCPFYDEERCRDLLKLAIIDLIKRLQDENERMRRMVSQNEGVLPQYESLIKTEAIKEYWNQRPPQLNPNQDGKNLYNQGWNDCISFFAEEYEIFLGIKKRAEEMVGDE
jgi:hypothetical protein